jgi:hypothetical protein
MYGKLLNKVKYVVYGRLWVHIKGIIIDEAETVPTGYGLSPMLSTQNKLVLNQWQGQL